MSAPPGRGKRPLAWPARLCAAAAHLAVALLLPASALAQQQEALLTHTERPARLIRKVAVYDAMAGVRLQPGDIVESGASGLQIEIPNGPLLALGPSSSVQLESAGGGAAVVSLLRGWLKIASGQVRVDAGALELRADNSNGIVYLAPDGTELFVEQGVLTVAELDRAGKAGTPRPVNREQYAQRREAATLQVAARPPRPFIAGMPRAFFDPLVRIASRVTPAKPVLLREVEARELTNWNAAGPALRKRLVARFLPRLADPAFRTDAESVLASTPEWQQALVEPAGQRPGRGSIANHLF